MELMGVLRSEHGPPGVGFACGVISSLLRQGRHRGTPCREAAYTLWRQLVEGREKHQKLDAVAYRIGGWQRGSTDVLSCEGTGWGCS